MATHLLDSLFALTALAFLYACFEVFLVGMYSWPPIFSFGIKILSIECARKEGTKRMAQGISIRGRHGIYKSITAQKVIFFTIAKGQVEVFPFSLRGTVEVSAKTIKGVTRLPVGGAVLVLTFVALILSLGANQKIFEKILMLGIVGAVSAIIMAIEIAKARDLISEIMSALQSNE
jgi:hypothetical protein